MFSDYKNTPKTIKMVLIVLLLALFVAVGIIFKFYFSDKSKPVVQASTSTPSDISISSERERISVLYGLPVMVPSNLTSFFNEPVYIYENALWETGYQLTVDSTITCRGSDACRLADVDLNRYTPLDFTSGTQVKLDYNITGYYSPLTCGVSCGDAMIIWRENNYDVTVGVHSGTENSVTKLSNFIISNQIN